jgi:hypothetical protein
MRVAADGYIDLRDERRIRTPGFYGAGRDTALEPVPEGEALSFLLSHSFPGHRRVVRSMTLEERKRIRLALWANSVSERMSLVDRIWRSITEPVPPPPNGAEVQLIQVLQYEGWVYPLHIDGSSTRVIPLGGKSVAELAQRTQVLRLDLLTA